MSQYQHEAQNGDMKIALFVNDSYFSYLLAQHIINEHHKEISIVIFSSKNKRSIQNIISIFKKSNFHYFFYRSVIQVLSSLFSRHKTVRSLAIKHHLKCINLHQIKPNDIEFHDIAFAFNFDQLLSEAVIKKFKYGVISKHGSKLPEDKGISPVLWAYARGDKEIWSTLYQMDSGMDSGPIIEQFSIPRLKDESAFSLYERVSEQSGLKLAKIANLVLSKAGVQLTPQTKKESCHQHSWPDHRHRQLMKESGGCFFKTRDFFRWIFH